MNVLIDAVADSIVLEVAGAGDWTVEKKDPLWRSPKKGKVLNIFPGPERPGTPRWTEGTMDLIEIIVEYAEPSPQNAKLTKDETAEFAANDIARSIREWALAHEAGFAPAHKMDWVGTDYTPQVAQEFFVRYCRLTFQFEVAVSYG